MPGRGSIFKSFFSGGCRKRALWDLKWEWAAARSVAGGELRALALQCRGRKNSTTFSLQSPEGSQLAINRDHDLADKRPAA